MAQPSYIAKTLAAAVVNNIATSQTPLGAGNLTLNGAAVSGGVAVLDTQRQVLITQAADETGHTFTVYGTNDNGAAFSEAVAGSSAASVHTTQSFKTVTRVAVSAATTGAVQVGTNGVGSTPWALVNMDTTPMNFGLAVIISGTVNFTVNYTYEDPNNPVGTFPVAWALSALSAKSANTESNITFPICALSLQINSGTGTATLVMIEADYRGGPG